MFNLQICAIAMARAISIVIPSHAGEVLEIIRVLHTAIKVSRSPNCFFIFSKSIPALTSIVLRQSSPGFDQMRNQRLDQGVGVEYDRQTFERGRSRTAACGQGKSIFVHGGDMKGRRLNPKSSHTHIPSGRPSRSKRISSNSQRDRDVKVAHHPYPVGLPSPYRPAVLVSAHG